MSGQAIFVAHQSRRRLGALLALLFALGLIAVLAPIPTDGVRLMERLVFGLKVVGVLALAAVLFKLPSLLRASVAARIGPDGLFYAPFSDETVGWDQITKITERKINVQTILSVHLRNPAMFTIKRAARLQAALNKSAGDYGDIDLEVALTDRTLAEFRAVLEPYHMVQR